MIDKFPILKDHLNDLFKLFLTKSQSLIQMGKDKYLARLTKRNKEMNSNSSIIIVMMKMLHLHLHYLRNLEAVLNLPVVIILLIRE